MVLNDLLARINELAHKAKQDKLSKEERMEQQQLREKYLQMFRKRFEEHLHSITVVDDMGNDVTPSKLKKSKLRRKN